VITAENPDRVITVGGDGTVRIVADRLAQSGIPMAVVPVGTGNLLARNLEIPLSSLDDHRPPRRHAMICAIGNVGELAGNLTLIPSAQPDDGRCSRRRALMVSCSRPTLARVVRVLPLGGGQTSGGEPS
jgi:hypothetical protein